MLQDYLSPRIGSEDPIILSDFSNIENIVFKYGRADIKPVFSSYESFNQQHYQFHLHQYYKLEFNQTIDVLALINELKQVPEIENVEFNYILEINTTPNDPYYSSQWAHENDGQAVSENGTNVGTPDCDTDTNQAWDITTGENDVIIGVGIIINEIISF